MYKVLTEKFSQVMMKPEFGRTCCKTRESVVCFAQEANVALE
jgi:hypothetical protein